MPEVKAGIAARRRLETGLSAITGEKSGAPAGSLPPYEAVLTILKGVVLGLDERHRAAFFRELVGGFGHDLATAQQDFRLQA
jgi:hypothetical protein